MNACELDRWVGIERQRGGDAARAGRVPALLNISRQAQDTENRLSSTWSSTDAVRLHLPRTSSAARCSPRCCPAAVTASCGRRHPIMSNRKDSMRIQSSQPNWGTHVSHSQSAAVLPRGGHSACAASGLPPLLCRTSFEALHLFRVILSPALESRKSLREATNVVARLAMTPHSIEDQCWRAR